MLTHEQASILRAVKLGAVADSDYLPEELHEFFAPFDDYGRDPYLNSDGERTLAAYDASYTTIEKSELERLQALERKIEACKDSHLIVPRSELFGALHFALHEGCADEDWHIKLTDLMGMTWDQVWEKLPT